MIPPNVRQIRRHTEDFRDYLDAQERACRHK
jgi:hypothetical protein